MRWVRWAGGTSVFGVDHLVVGPIGPEILEQMVVHGLEEGDAVDAEGPSGPAGIGILDHEVEAEQAVFPAAVEGEEHAGERRQGGGNSGFAMKLVAQGVGEA
jgi:hypothetical protein